MDLTRQLIAAVKVQDECHLNGGKLNDMIDLVKSIKAEHEQSNYMTQHLVTSLFANSSSITGAIAKKFR